MEAFMVICLLPQNSEWNSTFERGIQLKLVTAAMASAALSSSRVFSTPKYPLLQSSCSNPKNALILEHLVTFPRLKAFRKSWKNESSTILSGGRQPITPPHSSIPPDGQLLLAEQQPWRNQSLCKCGCTRRSMLTSLGGATIANVMAGNIARAVEGYSSSADTIREAVHPARPGWYEEFYATVMNTSMRSYEAEVAGYKRELFSRLNDNVKTVLELGIGTGPNLAYYGGRPSIANVIGVDPNEKMARYAAGAAVAAGLSPDQFKFVHAVGEGLPLPNAAVDAVICTLVLCSVSDVSSTLKEVQRVLKPGGIFLFVEHVAAPEGDGLRFWQDLLDPLQQLVADGCHLKRETLGFIEAAEFARVDARRVTVSGASLIGPHVVGSAHVAW